MRPESTGVQDLNTKFRKVIPNSVTLTQHLRNNGYRTIGGGKVYHDEQPQEHKARVWADKPVGQVV